MIEDIHEPLSAYKTFIKDAHARNVSQYFEELVEQSEVDEQANIATVKDIRDLEKRIANDSSANNWRRALRVAVVAALAVFLIYIYIHYSWPWLLGPVLLFAPAIYKLTQLINDVASRVKVLEQQRQAKYEEALKQMEPLNRLYGWDIASRLITKTIPRLLLDPYFTNGRLSELRENFGLSEDFNEGRSVVFSQSGVINGNPFVLVRSLEHWMETKTYHGSLDISWTERVKDQNGEWKIVTRRQTLHASVEKPFPEYGNRTFIIYGNEAAPDLSFSRSPSDLSNLKEGLIGSWRKRRAIKKLEVKSRNITDGKSFTVMANREFDALFGAMNRDHEVQFRLLFTPLAQQEMLNLLKDVEVGYGDDFDFSKEQMINQIESAHMAATDIDADPSKFHSHELAQARKFFNYYQNDFFKSFYFGIAPILAIPLYQQHRSHSDIYRDAHLRRSCFWEHEAIANHFGEQKFQHPECITSSILKTRSRIEADGSQTVRVTAYGYEGINHTSYISVYGGDGHYHKVRVDWVEYNEVESDTDMLLWEKVPIQQDDDAATLDSNDGDMRKVFRGHGIDFENTIVRRSIVSAIIPN